MLLRIRQAISVWVIRLVQKLGPRKVEVMGREYEISEDVFNPKFYYTSRFMSENIKVGPDDLVLDMGTGCGIQAITSGISAKRVVAVDINPEAVRYARKNVTANGLKESVSVVRGDLFGPLKPANVFNAIIFTPPYMEGIPQCHLDHALFDPGKTLLRRFFKDARHYLRHDGYIQMLYSSIALPDEALKIAERYGWRHKLIAEENTRTERFLIYKLQLQGLNP